MTEEQEALNQSIQAGISLVEQTKGPIAQYHDNLTNLQAALNATKISAEQMGAAQVAAAASAIQPWLGVASTVSGALGQLFQDNKGMAIAQAIINTAQAITATFAQYGFTPIGIAAAAAQAAVGAAQIATISSTQPGSTRRPSVGGGRGARASGGGGNGNTPSAPERGVFIKLEGSSRFTREEVEGLIGQLIDAQKDGEKLVLIRQ
jgi:hypothetical protein